MAFGSQRAVGFSAGGVATPRKKKIVEMCSPLPKTLTLFMTKIGGFPYPIYDQTKNSILFMTVALNIVFKGLLFMVVAVMMKK